MSRRNIKVTMSPYDTHACRSLEELLADGYTVTIVAAPSATRHRYSDYVVTVADADGNAVAGGVDYDLYAALEQAEEQLPAGGAA